MRNPFGLFVDKRFGPYFVAQFLGAFNDNFLKNGIMLLVSFMATRSAMSINLLNNLGMLCVIFPMFLFTGLAGQWGDNVEKASYMRWMKVVEVASALLALLGFACHMLWVIFFSLFCLGAQSAFFSPVKYSYLPAALPDDLLLQSNAFVSLGTFIAILLGSIGAGVLMSLTDNNGLWIGLVVLILAVVGWMASCFIPKNPPPEPVEPWSRAVFKSLWQAIKAAQASATIIVAIFAFSWFWALGALVLTQVPSIAVNYLHGSVAVVTLLLSGFSIGIAVGAICCSVLSKGRIEYAWVLPGSLAMTVMLACFAFHMASASPEQPIVGVWRFLHTHIGAMVTLDTWLLGFFFSWCSIPLMTLMQWVSPKAQCARIMAANTIYNSAGAVIAIAVVMMLLGAGVSMPTLFKWVSGLNLVILIVLVCVQPMYFQRGIMWCWHWLVPAFTIRSPQALKQQQGKLYVIPFDDVVTGLWLHFLWPVPVHLVIADTQVDSWWKRCLTTTAYVVSESVTDDQIAAVQQLVAQHEDLLMTTSVFAQLREHLPNQTVVTGRLQFDQKARVLELGP